LYLANRLHRLNVPLSLLVVFGIVVATLALVWAHVQAVSASGGWVGGTPVTREAQANGFDLIMQVTPGPYFLGELLVANLILTNDSLTSATLQGSVQGTLVGSCGGAINLEATGGTAPHYRLPADTLVIPRCYLGTATLIPGATITLHEFVPLASSGKVTLRPESEVLPIAASPNGEQSGNWIPRTPIGHWPSLTISVAPTIPVDRRISLSAEGTEVQISAPLAARSHLYYTDTIACISDSGEGYGSFIFWKSISTTTVQEPECNPPTDPNVRWSYAVSAPGYAIASGQMGS
jgi:hypothetical protein